MKIDLVLFNDNEWGSKQKGALRSCTKWKAFIGRKRGKEQGMRKKLIISGKILWGIGGFYWADYLISTDQVIPD